MDYLHFEPQDLNFEYIRAGEVPGLQSGRSLEQYRSAVIVLNGGYSNSYYLQFCQARNAVNNNIPADSRSSVYYLAIGFKTQMSRFLMSREIYWPIDIHDNWDDDEWASYMGGEDSYVYDNNKDTSFSSFDILDKFVDTFLDTSLFPQMKHIVFVGHSAGGQMVHRYGLASKAHRRAVEQQVYMRFIPANPSTYTYLSPERPLNLPDPTGTPDMFCRRPSIFEFGIPGKPVPALPRASYNCSAIWDRYNYSVRYNYWRFGLDNVTRYLEESMAEGNLILEYAEKDFVYLHGDQDVQNTDIYLPNNANDSNLDKTCPALYEGYCRLQRGHAYFQYLKYLYGRDVHQLSIVNMVGHSSCDMFQSGAGIHALVTGLGF